MSANLSSDDGDVPFQGLDDIPNEHTVTEAKNTRGIQLQEMRYGETPENFNDDDYGSEAASEGYDLSTHKKGSIGQSPSDSQGYRVSTVEDVRGEKSINPTVMRQKFSSPSANRLMTDAKIKK